MKKLLVNTLKAIIVLSVVFNTVASCMTLKIISTNLKIEEMRTSINERYNMVVYSSGDLSNEQVITKLKTWEEEKKDIIHLVEENDIVALAKLTYGEAGGIPSLKEKAAVMWCALNHADLYGCSISSAASNRNRFYGYHSYNPVTSELRILATDVLTRYFMEKNGRENVGRVLPKTYIYFGGDGKHNYFREQYTVYKYWNWSLPNPYNS